MVLQNRRTSDGDSNNERDLHKIIEQKVAKETKQIRERNKKLEKEIERLKEKTGRTQDKKQEQVVNRREFLKKSAMSIGGLAALTLPINALEVRDESFNVLTGDSTNQTEYFSVNQDGPVNITNTNLNMNENSILSVDEINGVDVENLGADPNLGDVLSEGNIASQNIDMNDNSLKNVDEVEGKAQDSHQLGGEPPNNYENPTSTDSESLSDGFWSGRNGRWNLTTGSNSTDSTIDVDVYADAIEVRGSNIGEIVLDTDDGTLEFDNEGEESNIFTFNATYVDTATITLGWNADEVVYFHTPILPEHSHNISN